MKSMLPMLGKDFMSVSPTNAWVCIKVVTDFILHSHSNFQLFFCSLDFFSYFFHQGKKSIKDKQKVPASIPHKNFHNYNTASTDLRKKAVKKFEWWS